MTVFGTWPAQYAKDWDLVLEGADTIASINQVMKTVNYSVGCSSPWSSSPTGPMGRPQIITGSH